MNRIQEVFRDLKKKREKAVIVYITSGDPDIDTTYRLALELDKCGVDILELGVPFSDPIADGPTIQAASQRAFKRKVSLKTIFRLVESVRKRSDIPIVLMTYYNPVFSYGVARFVKDAVGAGVDGVIVPDLPPEEAALLITHSRRYDFESIFLLSPTSSPWRIRFISGKSRGFIYYVSLTGVTGARRDLPRGIAEDVRRIKRVTSKPVCVGFGISDPVQAKAVAEVSDGVIIGSAVIKVIERNLRDKKLPERVTMFVKGLVKGVKSI